jgi:hypothetical protein
VLLELRVEPVAAARTAATSATLLPIIVVVVGAMFRLQRSVLSRRVVRMNNATLSRARLPREHRVRGTGGLNEHTISHVPGKPQCAPPPRCEAHSGFRIMAIGFLGAESLPQAGQARCGGADGLRGAMQHQFRTSARL